MSPQHTAAMALVDAIGGAWRKAAREGPPSAVLVERMRAIEAAAHEPGADLPACVLDAVQVLLTLDPRALTRASFADAVAAELASNPTMRGEAEIRAGCVMLSVVFGGIAETFYRVWGKPRDAR